MAEDTPTTPQAQGESRPVPKGQEGPQSQPRATGQEINAYPASYPANKPPFDFGDGPLDWLLNKKAPQVFDAVWEGFADFFKGEGRAQQMEAQRAIHEKGSHEHFAGSNPEAPGSTPPGTPNPNPGIKR